MVTCFIKPLFDGGVIITTHNLNHAVQADLLEQQLVMIGIGELECVIAALAVIDRVGAIATIDPKHIVASMAGQCLRSGFAVVDLSAIVLLTDGDDQVFAIIGFGCQREGGDAGEVMNGFGISSAQRQGLTFSVEADGAGDLPDRKLRMSTLTENGHLLP